MANIFRFSPSIRLTPEFEAGIDFDKKILRTVTHIR